MGERASSATESPSFDIQGLVVSTGEIFLYTLSNVVQNVYHSFVKPWRIVYEEAPADARSCQQHSVHSDWHCAGEHG